MSVGLYPGGGEGANLKRIKEKWSSKKIGKVGRVIAHSVTLICALKKIKIIHSGVLSTSF